MIKKISFIIFLTLLILPAVYAAKFSSEEYGCGLYGIGCEEAPPGGGGGRAAITLRPEIVKPTEIKGQPEAEIIPEPEIEVGPTEIKVHLAVNTDKEYTIKVTNPSNTKKTVQVSQKNLDNMVILSETTLDLEPKETKELRVIFVALNEPGIFTGKIIIGNKEVLVSLNIKTKPLSNDANIDVLNKDYIVEQGDKLKTLVSLISKEDPGRVAPSSAYFKVVEKEKTPPLALLKEISLQTWIIIGAVGLFLIILAVILYLVKRKKRKKGAVEIDSRTIIKGLERLLKKARAQRRALMKFSKD